MLKIQLNDVALIAWTSEHRPFRLLDGTDDVHLSQSIRRQIASRSEIAHSRELLARTGVALSEPSQLGHSCPKSGLSSPRPQLATSVQ